MRSTKATNAEKSLYIMKGIIDNTMKPALEDFVSKQKDKYSEQVMQRKYIIDKLSEANENCFEIVKETSRYIGLLIRAYEDIISKLPDELKEKNKKLIGLISDEYEFIIENYFQKKQ
jgi:hypothetical protein